MPDEWISVTEAIGRLAQAKGIKPEKAIPDLLTLVAQKRLDTRIAKVVSASTSKPVRNVPMTEAHWDYIINFLPRSFGETGEVFFDDGDDTYWLGIEVHAGDFEREIGHPGLWNYGFWAEGFEQDGAYVTLTEALSWIAFGKLINKDQFEHLLSSPERITAERELRAAMRKLSEHARRGHIRLKGSYAANYCEPSANELVSSGFLSPEQLQEFSCFECAQGGLIRGDKLVQEAGSSSQPRDGWHLVVVPSDDLQRAFPATNEAGAKPAERKARRGRTRGTGYQRADAPLLEEMEKAISEDASLNATSAARLVAHKAEGQSFEAKVDRLSRRYRAEYTGRNGE